MTYQFEVGGSALFAGVERLLDLHFVGFLSKVDFSGSPFRTMRRETSIS